MKPAPAQSDRAVIAEAAEDPVSAATIARHAIKVSRRRRPYREAGLGPPEFEIVSSFKVESRILRNFL